MIKTVDNLCSPCSAPNSIRQLLTKKTMLHIHNRRVAELFTENIPEGEAHLMKNGRFACMVCGHRPVFDTVLILAQHREGKKHAASRAQKLEEEEEIRQLRRKRQHDEWSRTGQIPADLLEEDADGVGGSTKALLGAAAYDSRCKRSRPNHRKPTLDLSGDCLTDVTITTTPSVPAKIHFSECNWQSSSTNSDTWDTFQKNKNNRSPCTNERVSQKSNCAKRTNPVNPVTGKKIYNHVPSSTTKLSKSVKTIADHRKLQNVIAQEEEMITNVRPYQRKSTKPSPTIPDMCLSSPVNTCITEPTPRCAESLPRLQTPELIQGFASGYIKDKFGRWVKDHNAEFDSEDSS